MTNCESVTAELVECARYGAEPGRDLTAHLAVCDACTERRAAESELSAHLAALRAAPLSTPGDAWRKATLLREFDAHRKRERQVRWMWAMSSAAVFVLSVVAMRDVWMKPAPHPVAESAVLAQVYPQREYSREPFGPAEEAGEKGFIKVPFALPPAPGETFGIVRTELDPAALASMGVSVDPGWTGTLQADILVGEDGFTQAVRLSNDDADQK